jgi:hypothetical protein
VGIESVNLGTRDVSVCTDGLSVGIKNVNVFRTALV